MNELHVTFDGRSYTFQPGQTVLIGRMSDSSIVVSDPTVSRRHAQLTWGPAGWLFENLGQARAFQQGQEVRQVIVGKPIELSLASPQGPVVRLEPVDAADPQATSAPRRLQAPQSAFQAPPQSAFQAPPQSAFQAPPQSASGPPGFGLPGGRFGPPPGGSGPVAMSPSRGRTSTRASARPRPTRRPAWEMSSRRRSRS